MINKLINLGQLAWVDNGWCVSKENECLYWGM